MCFYEILGVNRNSTREQIKREYRRRVLRMHPNLNRNADARSFMEMKRAYDALMNEEEECNERLERESLFKGRVCFDLCNIEDVKNEKIICRCGGVYNEVYRNGNFIECEHCSSFIEILPQIECGSKQ
jgi:hypothetical protein